MRTRIVRIGKFPAVRIPKPLLEQTGLRGVVEVRVENDALVLRPAKRARQGWAAAFRQMAKRGDDTLLDDPTPSLSSWDEEYWQW